MQDNSKLIEEYRSMKNFIDKYIFYQNHWRELQLIKPVNALMIEFAEASKVLEENDKRVIINGVGYMDDRYRDAQLRKSNAINSINQYYKKILEPSNDIEGGQIIEFWVNKYQQESTFERKRIEFLESIKGENYANEIIAKQIEKVQIELNKISGINNLHIVLSETYKIDFTKIYKFVRIENEILKVKDHIKAFTNPLFISYEPLAKAIPLIQYRKFLEDFLKDDVLLSPQVNGKGKKEFKLIKDATLKETRIINAFKNEMDKPRMTQATALNNLKERTDLGVGGENPNNRKKQIHDILKSFGLALKKNNENKSEKGEKISL